jgi:glycosyltransferase involved in cell wall biosynthesis
VTLAVRETEPRAHGRRPEPGAPTALVIGPLPPPWHGGAVATRQLLDSALAERFRLVHLDTTDDRGMANIGRFDAGNVRLACAHLLRFWRLLRREDPDLVYVPLAQNRLGFLRDALFLLSARLRARRVIVHLHGGGFRAFYRETDPLTRALVRASIGSVARAIVLGRRLRPMLEDIVPAAHVAVVPNGIPDPHDGAGRAARADADTDAVRVVYLGTLMAEKGFLDVLDAAALLAQERPGIRYVFAGAFLRPDVRARAERALDASVRDRVEFAGVVAGVAKAALLRGADIFVFPTRYANEGHPYVVLEAMAAGLPIVTTARAAIPETIVDGESGMLVPESDPRALADAIRRLADDPALRARLGEAARARFLEHYTIASWAAGMTAVFEEALAVR